MLLSCNKDIELKRLKSTNQKLHSKNLFALYDEVFKNWLNLGITEVVRQCETNHEYYLPHKAVIKEKISTSICPVFDASTKTKCSPSLNQCLES